jgi:hypothetical protein
MPNAKILIVEDESLVAKDVKISLKNGSTPTGG